MTVSQANLCNMTFTDSNLFYFLIGVIPTLGCMWQSFPGIVQHSYPGAVCGIPTLGPYVAILPWDCATCLPWGCMWHSYPGTVQHSYPGAVCDNPTLGLCNIPTLGLYVAFLPWNCATFLPWGCMWHSYPETIQDCYPGAAVQHSFPGAGCDNPLLCNNPILGLCNIHSLGLCNNSTVGLCNIHTLGLDVTFLSCATFLPWGWM